MVTNTIQFTGEQAKNFAGVSPEGWRHWRKIVPSLTVKHGKKARFSAGEIVALTVMASVVDSLDVGVSGLAKRWNDLFVLCAAQRPSGLRSAYVVITADSVRLVGTDLLQLAEPAIVVPCEPIVERLWAAAFSGDVEQAQASLPFPPRVVGGASR